MTEVNTRRRYSSPRREQQANATTKAILQAAETLFARDGFTNVTMRAIAREADVAMATVYLHFDGKAAIVGALADDVVNDPALSVELVETAHGAAEQLRRGAAIMTRLNERSWLIADILRTNAGRDPELTATWAEWQARHLDAVRRGTQAVAAAGGLRPGLSVEQATDVLYAITGTDVFRSLVGERGWTLQAYEAWLTDWATRELMGE